jgi:cell division septation protein DedD
MIRKISRFYLLAIATPMIIFNCGLAGCAGTSKRTGKAVGQPEEVPPPPEIEAGQDAQPAQQQTAQPYDLESEMPEDDSVDESEASEESIDPVPADTFSVEETVEPPAAAAGYGLGYRIQLAAFTESAAARDLKKKVMAGAEIAVYIDYEDGLYKVRAGDFSTREAASEARARLAADFPECWIVRTTVMKAE